MGLRLVLGLGAAAWGLVGAGAQGDAAVDMRDFAFSPAEIRVAPGAAVAFVNHDAQTHTATSAKPRLFDTGNVEPGATGGFLAPTAPGVYAFYCVHHAGRASVGAPFEGMVGALVVDGPARDAPAAGWMALVALAFVAATLRR